jgi:hypothetical protein
MGFGAKQDKSLMKEDKKIEKDIIECNFYCGHICVPCYINGRG